jgi:hypothetical protein
MFAALLMAALGLYLARARGNVRPDTGGLVFLCGCAVLLLAAYFYWVSWYVWFPADILIWSEGDFVNDIIKFSVGYPLYSPQVNNDSFTYVPGAQLLTYLLAFLAAKGSSIPVYRCIQVGFTAAAAFMAELCCRRVLRISGVRTPGGQEWLWSAFRYGALLLIATNSITNRFTHNLHGDALAQLATLTAYYLLLVYIDTGRRRTLVAMAFVGPAGFLIKQSLLIWVPWYCGFLLIWRPGWRRLAVFAGSTIGLIGATVGLCYVIWGEPFFYWVFHVLGAHGVSPLRSFQHVLDAWVYFAVGLLGGVAVLRGRQPGPLMGAWLIWLGLITLEAYTSGIAWMLNHIGPGCLIAGVWFLAGLMVVWERMAESWERPGVSDWMASGALAGSVALLFSGMGLVRIPVQPLSNDAYRYVNEIEAQFRDQASNRILLDAGSWIYARDRVVMGDRAPSIGERGSSSTGDFSGILSRIAQKHYAKILVRDFHDADFWYEHFSWPKPSGIREALRRNYQETGRIRAVTASVTGKDRAEDPYLFGEVTILEPKAPEL